MKKLLIILVAVMCFGLTVNAGCWKDNFVRSFSGDRNIVQIENVCRDTYTFVVKWIEPESGKWQQEELTLEGGKSWFVRIGSATKDVIYQKD